MGNSIKASQLDELKNSEYDLLSYDYYIICFSGGKDSIACFLYLLEQGVPIHKIELWHHDIDGREQTLFDWEITPDYCRKFAEAFGVKIYFQWKDGGFKREMFRKNSLTASTYFENEDYTLSKVGGEKGKISTRLKYPQCSPDLTVRYCSAYLKIDVCTKAINNQERFRNKRTLVLSGERGEESVKRATYNIWEPDRSNLENGKKFSRIVHRHRPLIKWKEREVWAIIEKYRVRVHPCYYMGWSRCSCKWCIFGNPNQLASAAFISPKQAKIHIGYEKHFGVTIKRNTDLKTFISQGIKYDSISDELARLSISKEYHLSIIMDKWYLPAGAFSNSSCAA